MARFSPGLLVATIIGALAIWGVVSWAVTPTLPETVVLTGDETIVALTNQGERRITILVPTKGAKPVAQATIAPFALGALQPREVPAGDAAGPIAVYRAELVLPADSPAPGQYLAAVIEVGDAQRKILVKFTAPPQWPTLAVLAGLGLAYGASWWRLFARRATLIELEAGRLWQDLEIHAARRGDLNRDDYPEYSIHNAMSALIGMGNAPSDDSIRGRLRDGRVDDADKRLAECREFTQAFARFIEQGRELHTLHLDLDPALLDATPQPVIIQAGAAIINPSPKPKELAKETIAAAEEEVAAVIAAYRALEPVAEQLTDARTLVDQLEATNPEGWQERKDRDTFRGLQLREQAARKALFASDSATAVGNTGKTIAELLRDLYPLAGKYLRLFDTRAQPSGFGLPPGTAKRGQRVTQLSVGALRRRVQIADWFFLMVGVLVATTSALAVLYTGRAFGTPFDYLGAFLWGIGVEQAVKGLSGVLDKLGIPLVPGAAGSAPKAEK